MQTPYWQVDAFTGHLFAGNPAGVCLLEEWLDDPRLQALAAENNLSETAFLVRGEDATRYDLRWFTPEVEVDLCGHATLAAAFVLFREGLAGGPEVRFGTRSGELTASREGDRIWLDFPSRPPRPTEAPDALAAALGVEPREVEVARDWLVVVESAEHVRWLTPDMEALRHLPGDRLGVIVTAEGEGGTDDGAATADFVSRFFAPGAGVPEDPVTGSSHCTLAPYWAERLGKRELHGRQLSRRGGELWCVAGEKRVRIGGECVLYLAGAASIA